MTLSNRTLSGVIGLFLMFSLSTAADDPVVAITICQKIDRREPHGPTLQNADRFKILNNKVYAWTRLKKEISGGFIHHVWHFQESIMDDIRMPIGAQFGRIYSAKTIKRPYVGVWRVEVRQEDKTLLETRYFLVELLNNELFATVLERKLSTAQPSDHSSTSKIHQN